MFNTCQVCGRLCGGSLKCDAHKDGSPVLNPMHPHNRTCTKCGATGKLSTLGLDRLCSYCYLNDTRARLTYDPSDMIWLRPDD